MFTSFLLFGSSIVVIAVFPDLMLLIAVISVVLVVLVVLVCTPPLLPLHVGISFSTGYVLVFLFVCFLGSSTRFL